MAFDKPNYTQAPNLFFDKYLPKITALSELKVTLIVLRNTVGWHEKEVIMDIPYLIGATGLGRQSVVDGIKLALGRGTVVRRPAGHSFSYEANIKRVQNLDSLTVQISERNVDCCEEEALIEKETNTHVCAREEVSQASEPVFNPERSKKISQRPGRQRSGGARKPSPGPAVYALPDEWKFNESGVRHGGPHPTPIIQMLKEMGLKVPHTNITLAVDEYIRNRSDRDGKPITCPPERDCLNYIRNWARNHWLKRYRPDDVDGGWVPPEWHWSMDAKEQKQFEQDYEM